MNTSDNPEPIDLDVSNLCVNLIFSTKNPQTAHVSFIDVAVKVRERNDAATAVSVDRC